MGIASLSDGTSDDGVDHDTNVDVASGVIMLTRMILIHWSLLRIAS